MEDQDYKSFEPINPLNIKNSVEASLKYNHLVLKHDSSVPDLETQVVKLQQTLQQWREVILCVYSLLLWEKAWHASVIAGGVLVCFQCIYVVNPSLLTIIASLGLLITLCDFLVPILASTFIRSEWTARKEKQFNEICKKMVTIRTKLTTTWNDFILTRTTKPRWFYPVTSGILLAFSWLGNKVDNLLLTCLIVMFLLLIPGMERQGLLKEWRKRLCQTVSAGKDRLKTIQIKKQN